MKRIREGARIVLINPTGRFLLMHFAYGTGPLGGTDYWGLPGGGLESGETPSLGAIRELREETGLVVADIGSMLAESNYDFRLSSGEDVVQRDRYFSVRVGSEVSLSRDGFTAEERENLVETRWWSLAELRATGERVIPSDMADILAKVLPPE